MSNIAQILETIKSYSPDADTDLVMNAYAYAARAHRGQTRKSGEDYFIHPLAVAQILADMHMDVDTVATGLLHDALEDSPLTKAELAEKVGPVVAELVEGVTKIGKLRFRNSEQLAAENFRKMMLAMSKDLRVILVKLADRIHNMSTLEFQRQDKQVRISQETMDIFVPIANRLGLTHVKAQLEDMCFRYLHPEEYQEIHSFLEQTQADRQTYALRVQDLLRDDMAARGVSCTVTGRAKHPFSVFRKMVSQGLKVHEVHDLLAFRLIVEDLGQCYAALGFVHAAYPPFPDRIKDYIARAKPNGYQSLHTTVIGPEGRQIEVQIRTAGMHRIAEEGIAAHWRYKEGHLDLSPEDVAKMGRIRELFETAQEIEDATDFMETLKFEFYSDKVYVFTPAGDHKELPLGASALDFAYMVHSEVGEHCTGARVNGKMVPLRYVLQSGDSVEILTAERQHPSRDWLGWVRTGRASQKIRRYLRQAEIEEGRKLGKDMLVSELVGAGSSLKKVRESGTLTKALQRHGVRDEEALFVEVAYGNVKLSSLLKHLVPDAAPEEPAGLSSLFQRFRPRTESPILITGEDGIMVHYAGCCAPLPGEPVVGFVTRGKGIKVHAATCPELERMDPERKVAVAWVEDREARHSAALSLFCDDRPGLLAAVTGACEQLRVNINQVEATTSADTSSLVKLVVAVRDVQELERLVKRFKQVRGVNEVVRSS
ncbi:MAG: bifunctional (p)ppGpp synthetase/guanosine-3',5'-bis(diphosphate) 3'-pyrophosphohydrolase [Deltaproteobacteria bacterium]|nr:bifunctional (p)ppGpp synthetase/guanosine-3',5'-bis(diphosphate) 3'-pyrophosphohydrolase [Deltaproteobacteria bacterium]